MNSKQDNHQYDIAGILLALWRRRIIITAAALTAIFATAVYYYTRPVVMTAAATVKIGKLAHIKIESYPDTMFFINSTARGIRNGVAVSAAVSPLNMYSPDDLYGTLLLDVSASSADLTSARSALDYVLKKLIDRHKTLFDRASSALKKGGSSVNSERSALLMIESYTFPTVIDGGIRSSARRDIKGNSSGTRGLFFYLMLSLIASFIISSSAVLAFDYIRDEISKRS